MTFHFHPPPVCTGGPKGACTQDGTCATMGREQRCALVSGLHIGESAACRCWHDPRRFSVQNELDRAYELALRDEPANESAVIVGRRASGGPGFRGLPQPCNCCVLIEDASPDELIRTIKLAEYDGAEAFDLELQSVDPQHRTSAALKVVFESTNLPIFTVYRRYVLSGAEMRPVDTDEAGRMQLQLDLLNVGSIGFDMELDTFDPHSGHEFGSPEALRYSYDRASEPLEISTSREAVERQLEVVGEAHRRGGQVMASTHALTRLSSAQALQIGHLAEERNADAVKIVQFCADYDDVIEALASTVLLKSQLRIPYVMMAMGEYGKLIRILGPMFGSMLVFTRQDYRPGSFMYQPLVRAMRNFYSNADFRITRQAQAFLPPS